MRRASKARRVVALGALTVGCGVAGVQPATAAVQHDHAGRYRAEIVRTSYGVPHITATDWGSLGFGQGYAQAEDRICTLLDQVVKVRGERARWFGAGPRDAYLNSDVAYRELGLVEDARRQRRAAPRWVRATVDGFAAGVNRYLARVGRNGVKGWCKGAPWLGPIRSADVEAIASDVKILASSRQYLREIATAQPPSTAATATAARTRPTAIPPMSADPAHPGSNVIALGADRSAGAATVYGNPHWAWEGELRFWESHLTLPGRMNVYGASFVGLPGIQLGFNRDLGWAFTYSAGQRSTLYDLKLVDGDPTAYRYDGQVRRMQKTLVTVQVRQPDGKVADVSRTLWRSHHGPIVNVGPGWTAERALALKDSQLAPTGFLQSWLKIDRATSLDDLDRIMARFGSFANIGAAGRDGKAWYADATYTPNLSRQTIGAWLAARKSGLAGQIWQSGGFARVLLDGSTSSTEWVDAPGASTPGLVPYKRQPRLVRDDFILNANDPSWLTNPRAPLTGFSPLVSEAGNPPSPRTRRIAERLLNVTRSGPAGADRRFTLRELERMVRDNHGLTAGLLRDGVVDRCRGHATAQAPDGATVEIAQACELLASWDGAFDLDSVGALVWREFAKSFPDAAFRNAGPLYAVPFDPKNPIATPNTIAPAPAGAPDPILGALARSVQSLKQIGIPLDGKLGDYQFDGRVGEPRTPVPGADTSNEGTISVNRCCAAFLNTTLAPQGIGLPYPSRNPPGYPITYGDTYVFSVQFDRRGPHGDAMLLFGQPDSPASPLWTSQLRLYAQKQWRPALFTRAAIDADAKRRRIVTDGR